MSNTRKPNSSNRANRSPNPLFEALAGHTIPGGCDECDAEQRFTREADGIYRCTIAHDDGCPFLARRRAGAR